MCNCSCAEGKYGIRTVCKKMSPVFRSPFRIQRGACGGNANSHPRPGSRMVPEGVRIRIRRQWRAKVFIRNTTRVRESRTRSKVKRDHKFTTRTITITITITGHEATMTRTTHDGTLITSEQHDCSSAHSTESTVFFAAASIAFAAASTDPTSHLQPCSKSRYCTWSGISR